MAFLTETEVSNADAQMLLGRRPVGLIDEQHGSYPSSAPRCANSRFKGPLVIPFFCPERCQRKFIAQFKQKVILIIEWRWVATWVVVGVGCPIDWLRRCWRVNHWFNYFKLYVIGTRACCRLGDFRR